MKNSNNQYGSITLEYFLFVLGVTLVTSMVFPVFFSNLGSYISTIISVN